MPAPDEQTADRLEQARAGIVNVGGRNRPFGELSADEARLQAAELKDAGTWGPMQRVVKVALAWGELARIMDGEGAATVGELPDETVLTFAERVWVISPGEGLIWSEAAKPASEGGVAMTDQHDQERNQGRDEHEHTEPHNHEHSHGGETHSHAHDEHEHEHVEHEHEHSHGEVTHSHPHVHQDGLEDDHTHDHDEGQ